MRQYDLKMDTSQPCPIQIHGLLFVALRLLEKPAMIAVLIFLGLIAAGSGIGLIATAMAPVGYEDESGFHFGQINGSSKGEFVGGVPQPKLA
jgi:hypothetical protein